MRKAALRKEILFDINYLTAKNSELESKIENYDSTFSDADEFPFSKEDLQNELDKNKKELLRLENELKQIEKV